MALPSPETRCGTNEGGAASGAADAMGRGSGGGNGSGVVDRPGKNSTPAHDQAKKHTMTNEGRMARRTLDGAAALVG